jgi:Mg-chelatase subunit ChlD
VVDTQAFAKLLAEKYASKMFHTSEGQKTGAELARELADRPGVRFDISSQDGSLQANVRGGRSIVNGKPEAVQRAVEHQQRGTGCGQGGGGLASKTGLDEMLRPSALSPEIAEVAPLIREIGAEGVVEVLRGWVQAPAKNRVCGGREHRVLKGVTHLSAMRAQAQFDEVRDGEQTLTRFGERVDFIVGRNPMAPLNAVRTMARAIAAGGIIDDQAEVREVRITVDAPHLVFVTDTSGSMGFGDRMLGAMASAQAIAEYYGPRGASFGYIELTGGDPVLSVPPGEPSVERVLDAVLSMEVKGGTAYAPAIELAIRAAQPKTTVMVFGDFEDTRLLSQEALALKSEKDIRVIGITDASGDVGYAAEMCDEVHIVDMSDPAQVALVALKAAE